MHSWFRFHPTGVVPSQDVLEQVNELPSVHLEIPWIELSTELSTLEVVFVVDDPKSPALHPLRLDNNGSARRNRSNHNGSRCRARSLFCCTIDDPIKSIKAVRVNSTHK